MKFILWLINAGVFTAMGAFLMWIIKARKAINEFKKSEAELEKSRIELREVKDGVQKKEQFMEARQKQENEIYELYKREIKNRKKNPKYQIAVSLKSLRERFPIEKYPAITNEECLSILNKLYNDEENLFDGFDPSTREFYYKGSIVENIDGTT